MQLPLTPKSQAGKRWAIWQLAKPAIATTRDVKRTTMIAFGIDDAFVASHPTDGVLDDDAAA
jgi:hypothetical protein